MKNKNDSFLKYFDYHYIGNMLNCKLMVLKVSKYVNKFEMWG